MSDNQVSRQMRQSTIAVPAMTIGSFIAPQQGVSARRPASGIILVPLWDPKKNPAPVPTSARGVPVSRSVAAIAEGRLEAYPVSGDCMAPLINDGDRIIVDVGRSWRDGDIVIAFIRGKGLLLKRAFQEGESIVLRADAPGWPELHEKDTHVLGVVIASSRPYISTRIDEICLSR